MASFVVIIYIAHLTAVVQSFCAGLTLMLLVMIVLFIEVFQILLC